VLSEDVKGIRRNGCQAGGGRSIRRGGGGNGAFELSAVEWPAFVWRGKEGLMRGGGGGRGDIKRHIWRENGWRGFWKRISGAARWGQGFIRRVSMELNRGGGGGMAHLSGVGRFAGCEGGCSKLSFEDEKDPLVVKGGVCAARSKLRKYFILSFLRGSC
jgi:hypothetical protein